IDIDPKRKKGISATEKERLAALECRDRILSEHLEIAESSIWGCSGNGGFILVRLPDLPNDDEHVGLLRAVIRTLAEWYDGEYSGVRVRPWPRRRRAARGRGRRGRRGARPGAGSGRESSRGRRRRAGPGRSGRFAGRAGRRAGRSLRRWRPWG